MRLVLWAWVRDWVGCELGGSSYVVDSIGSVDDGVAGDVGVDVVGGAVVFPVGHGDFGKRRQGDS